MGVLPDHYIRELCFTADPLVAPFKPERVQPASYDVALGEEFRVFNLNDFKAVDLGNPETFKDLTSQKVVPAGEKFVLHPGEFVLGITEEAVVIPDNMVSRIEGKSSLGRLGLIVHATAGYIDPGFRGRITLEMTNLLRIPIILRPGLAIAQLSFQYLESAAAHPYRGRYQGDMGVAPSRFGIDPKRGENEDDAAYAAGVATDPCTNR
jgi:dCTP deaminase